LSNKNLKSGIIFYQTFIGCDKKQIIEQKIPDEDGRWFLVNFISNKF